MAGSGDAELTTQNEIFVKPKFRLGRLPRKANVKSLIMANYTADVPPPPPKATNYWTRRKGFPPETWGNDVEGCCTIASQANMFRRFERIELKTQTIVISTEEVHRVYRNMTQELYGGGDTGAYEEDALGRSRKPETCLHDLKQHPLLIDAFVRANPADQVETKQAIAMAAGHGVKFCINLPLGFQELVDQGKDWDYPDNTPLTGSWMAGSWGGHCLAGKTRIPLLSGENVPIQDLVGQKDLWVYGCNPNSEPTPACARAVVRTKKQVPMVRVIIDEGEDIWCTPDHLFMLRDGSYLPAKMLTFDTRLMPLRRITHHRGYEKLKWYDKGKKQGFTHRMVALALGCPPELIVDHDDENKTNNHPDNLIWKTQGDHMRRHRPWELSGASGWFRTEAGQKYVNQDKEARQKRLDLIPDGENHKVIMVVPGGDGDVFDLIDVSPTNNFAAESVFVHNSMFAIDYSDRGVLAEQTWGILPQWISWRAWAAYVDELHVVIDSVDIWRQKKTGLDLDAIVSDVNNVSSTKIGYH